MVTVVVVTVGPSYQTGAAGGPGCGLVPSLESSSSLPRKELQRCCKRIEPSPAITTALSTAHKRMFQKKPSSQITTDQFKQARHAGKPSIAPEQGAIEDAGAPHSKKKAGGLQGPAVALKRFLWGITAADQSLNFGHTSQRPIHHPVLAHRRAFAGWPPATGCGLAEAGGASGRFRNGYGGLPTSAVPHAAGGVATATGSDCQVVTAACAERLQPALRRGASGGGNEEDFNIRSLSEPSGAAIRLFADRAQRLTIRESGESGHCAAEEVRARRRKGKRPLAQLVRSNRSGHA